jgi:hypothetical protein
MPIVGQLWNQIDVNSTDAPISRSQTIAVDNLDISAEIALCFVAGGYHASALITQIVSSAGVEEPIFSVFGRAGTTSVTFTLVAIDSGTAARWIISYWKDVVVE